MFKEGLAKFFGGKSAESKKGEKMEYNKTPEAPSREPDVSSHEKDTENESNPYSFEVAKAEVEKAPGKGEDRSIIFDDGKKKLYAVLDGMGGQEGGGGDVAAQIVAEAFQKEVSKIDLASKDEKEIKKILTEAVLKANDELQKNPTAAIFEKMGTTLTAMVCHDNRVSVVSVGDSRAYRLREGKLEQLSFEDSVLYILKENGYDINMGILSVVSPDGDRHDITLNEAMRTTKRELPYTSAETQQSGNEIVSKLVGKFGEKTLKELRNINTGGIAVGDAPPAVHVRTYEVEDGDEYFVTSDGLTDNCLDGNIEQGLNKVQKMSSEARARELSNYAKRMQDRSVHPDANKPDDVTVVYFKAKQNGEAEEIEESELEELDGVGT